MGAPAREKEKEKKKTRPNVTSLLVDAGEKREALSKIKTHSVFNDMLKL